jgi:signal transduction histidine kinase
VDTDPGAPDGVPFAAAGRLLAERGVYGLVWIDDDLTVTARYGRLADFVEVGEPITSSVPPLIGLERDVVALRHSLGTVVDIPAVSIIADGKQSPRLNLTVLWSTEEETYILLISRAVPRSDLQIEFSRQIRGRLLAEGELKRKSLDLARANCQLARANHDLEEFAAIISHDLKAPMRALRYLADDIERELGGTIVGKAREKLGRLKEQSRRMSDMLTALLEYSSAGRKAEVVEAVDTRALVGGIVGSVHRGPAFVIEVDGVWPKLETLRAPLDLVLRNLIDNAVKHHDREDGVVRVSGADGAGEFEITISDDGPGVAPKHREAILLPFRKLSEHTDGQGMGLAVVSRTLGMLGGRLELLSCPEDGRGATFRVSWPKTITC